MPEKELLSVAEVLKWLGIGNTTFYALVAKKEIPIIKIGRSTKVDRADIEAWLAGLRQKTNGGAA